MLSTIIPIIIPPINFPIYPRTPQTIRNKTASQKPFGSIQFQDNIPVPIQAPKYRMNEKGKRQAPFLELFMMVYLGFLFDFSPYNKRYRWKKKFETLGHLFCK